MLIRDLMRSWRSSWWRWRVFPRESSACGSKTSAARTRRRPFRWSCKCSRRR